MQTKHWWANIQLLDRQLVDGDGLMGGNVDDLEIEVDDDGSARVSALLAGPGVLWPRLGARRLGRWLRRTHAQVADRDDDPARIPLRDVATIGPHIVLSRRHDTLGTFDGERWTREHVIGRLPGSRHAPPAE